MQMINGRIAFMLCKTVAGIHLIQRHHFFITGNLRQNRSRADGGNGLIPPHDRLDRYRYFRTPVTINHHVFGQDGERFDSQFHRRQTGL